MAVHQRYFRSVLRYAGLKIGQNQSNHAFLHSTFTKPSILQVENQQHSDNRETGEVGYFARDLRIDAEPCLPSPPSPPPLPSPRRTEGLLRCLHRDARKGCFVAFAEVGRVAETHGRGRRDARKVAQTHGRGRRDARLPLVKSTSEGYYLKIIGQPYNFWNRLLESALRPAMALAAADMTIRLPSKGFVVMAVHQRYFRSVLRYAGLKIGQNQSNHAFLHSTFTKPSILQGQSADYSSVYESSSRRLPGRFFQFLQHKGYFSSRSLSAEAENMEPISSPLIPVLGVGGQASTKGSGPRRTTVQAIKINIRQSPRKMNLVAKLVRGMRVEDALLQMQVLVKRAAKFVYQVIYSARANATHNHGLDPDKLIIAEAYVGKGVFLKRISYHAKGRSGIMVRPKCRLTVVVREITPEEEATIAKVRVTRCRKLTRKEKQLFPHKLIEVSPRWSRKRKEEAAEA